MNQFPPLVDLSKLLSGSWEELKAGNSSHFAHIFLCLLHLFFEPQPASDARRLMGLS